MIPDQHGISGAHISSPSCKLIGVRNNTLLNCVHPSPSHLASVSIPLFLILPHLSTYYSMGLCHSPDTLLPTVMQDNTENPEVARLKRTIAELEDNNEQLRTEKEARDAPR